MNRITILFWSALGAIAMWAAGDPADPLAVRIAIGVAIGIGAAIVHDLTHAIVNDGEVDA